MPVPVDESEDDGEDVNTCLKDVSKTKDNDKFVKIKGL